MFKLARKAPSMSFFLWIFTLWQFSVLLLLLVGFGGRQLGLRVGLRVVRAAACSRWGTPIDEGLFQDGDVVIGGLFSLHYKPPDTTHNFTQLPIYTPCTG